MSNVTTLIVVGAVMFAVLGGVTLLSPHLQSEQYQKPNGR